MEGGREGGRKEWMEGGMMGGGGREEVFMAHWAAILDVA
jgi:hypothetical protein